MQYNSIPENQQANMLGAFWSMLRADEERAWASNNAFEKRLVESRYDLWNACTGEKKKPVWVMQAENLHIVVDMSR